MNRVLLISLFFLAGCSEPKPLEVKTIVCDGVTVENVVDVRYLPTTGHLKYKTKDSYPQWAGFFKDPNHCITR